MKISNISKAHKKISENEVFAKGSVDLSLKYSADFVNKENFHSYYLQPFQGNGFMPCQKTFEERHILKHISDFITKDCSLDLQKIENITKFVHSIEKTFPLKSFKESLIKYRCRFSKNMAIAIFLEKLSLFDNFGIFFPQNRLIS